MYKNNEYPHTLGSIKNKMKNKIIFLSFIWVLSVSNSIAQKIKLDSLDVFIHQLMEDFDLPGLSIGIIQNDSILYLKGYGIREIHKEPPVNENTIFGIGSISKSFTALTLGILVDEGKINWDDKVTTYLPYFELYNPYVTESFTIRDLLTHRSGLKSISGGTLWYHSNYSRVDIIKRLKYLEPVSGYREKPAYQNVMYVVAGEIVREVTGISWDAFLKTRIFDKIGMNNSTSISAVRESNNNLAQPHIWNKAYQKVAIKQEQGDNLAPGGFIYSSANEMANYIRLLLNDGVFGKDTIVSAKIINEIFKPQIIYPRKRIPFYNEFTSYGLGWWLTPKNSHKIIEHSGGIDGMSANLVMVKDMNIGFIILTNEAEEPAKYLLTAKILEQVLEDKSYDIYNKVKEQRDNNLKSNKVSPNKKIKISNTLPSLELSSYIGVYNDKMYGDVMINQLTENELEISFSHSSIFRGKLEHWHFDTFKIDWYDIRVPDGFLTFDFNSNREILGITIDQENLLDVDFGELEILKKEN